MFQAVFFLTSPAQQVTYVVIPGSPCTAHESLSRAGSQLCKLSHLIFLCLTEKKQKVVWQDKLQTAQRDVLLQNPAKVHSSQMLFLCLLQYLHCCGRRDTNNTTGSALKIAASVQRGVRDREQCTAGKTSNSESQKCILITLPWMKNAIDKHYIWLSFSFSVKSSTESATAEKLCDIWLLFFKQHFLFSKAIDSSRICNQIKANGKQVQTFLCKISVRFYMYIERDFLQKFPNLFCMLSCN